MASKKRGQSTWAAVGGPSAAPGIVGGYLKTELDKVFKRIAPPGYSPDRDKKRREKALQKAGA